MNRFKPAVILAFTLILGVIVGEITGPLGWMLSPSKLPYAVTGNASKLDELVALSNEIKSAREREENLIASFIHRTGVYCRHLSCREMIKRVSKDKVAMDLLQKVRDEGVYIRIAWTWFVKRPYLSDYGDLVLPTATTAEHVKSYLQNGKSSVELNPEKQGPR